MMEDCRIFLFKWQNMKSPIFQHAGSEWKQSTSQSATEPNSKEPRQTMLSAASQVGSASHRVLYTIGEEEVADKDRQDVLLGLAKAVANTTAALVLKAKNVASKCPDQSTQNRVSFEN